MKIKPAFAITWGREPIDTRIGFMLGSEYDFFRPKGRGDAVRCIRFDAVLGLLWVNVRFGVILW